MIFASAARLEARSRARILFRKGNSGRIALVLTVLIGALYRLRKSLSEHDRKCTCPPQLERLFNIASTSSNTTSSDWNQESTSMNQWLLEAYRTGLNFWVQWYPLFCGVHDKLIGCNQKITLMPAAPHSRHWHVPAGPRLLFWIDSSQVVDLTKAFAQGIHLVNAVPKRTLCTLPFLDPRPLPGVSVAFRFLSSPCAESTSVRSFARTDWVALFPKKSLLSYHVLESTAVTRMRSSFNRNILRKRLQALLVFWFPFIIWHQGVYHILLFLSVLYQLHSFCQGAFGFSGGFPLAPC